MGARRRAHDAGPRDDRGIPVPRDRDVDVPVDVMASTSNISAVIKQLESMGFALKGPGLRGTAFHRMTRGALVAGILVADHLPSGKARSAKVNRWPMMEIAGGPRRSSGAWTSR